MKCVLSMLVVLLMATSAQAELGLQDPVTDTTAVFSRYELRFDADRTYDNPYDSEEVSIDAHITTPSGKTHTMPCFWMVPVKEKQRIVDEASWRLRYTPLEQGAHSVTLQLVDKVGRRELTTTTFNAIPAENSRGLLRPDPWNPQFMRFDNGEPYYPLGMNVGAAKWPGVLNWRRYWLATFGEGGLEWTKGPGIWSDYEGLGRYSQLGAALLDREVETCEQNGRYMQLVFHYHEQVLDGKNPHHKFDGTPEWNDPGSPYWTGNGGPVEKAADWHSNEEARKYHKRLYRYIVARWGYSTHIFGWELFNETDYSSSERAGKLKAIVEWHDEMSRYLKSIDPYQRIVLTSISHPYWGHVFEQIGRLDEIDQVQNHLYSDRLRDMILPVQDRFARMKTPTWMGEFGMDKPERDPTGRHLRRSYWASMMNAQPAMYWYPYGYEERFRPLFERLRDFMADIDIVQQTGGKPVRFEVLNQDPVAAEIHIEPPITNWGAEPVSNRYEIRQDGTVQNHDQLTRHVYGRDQDGKNRSLVFLSNFATSVPVEIELKGGSESETSVVIVAVDGEADREVPLSGKSVSYQLELPAGRRVLSLSARARGFEFSSMTLRAQRNPLVSLGYAGRHFACGYIYDASVEDFNADAGPLHQGRSVVVPGLAEGKYVASFTDPKGDAVLDVVRLESNGLGVRIPLPDFREDLAFKVTPGN